MSTFTSKVETRNIGEEMGEGMDEEIVEGDGREEGEKMERIWDRN